MNRIKLNEDIESGGGQSVQTSALSARRGPDLRSLVYVTTRKTRSLTISDSQRALTGITYLCDTRYGRLTEKYYCDSAKACLIELSSLGEKK